MFKYLKIFFRGGYKIPFYYPKISNYNKNKDKYPIEERYAFARKLCLLVMKALNIEYNITNLDYLTSAEGIMLAPNHQSLLDSVTLICLSEKPILFLYKKEIKKIPFVGKTTNFIDCHSIDREDLKQSVKVLLKCKQSLQENKNLVVFAEGTRSKDEFYSIGEFKAGSFKPVMSAQKNILPVVINGSYKPLSKHYKQKKYIVDVSFLKPITYEEYKDLTSVQLAKDVEQKVKNEYKKLQSKQKI